MATVRKRASKTAPGKSGAKPKGGKKKRGDLALPSVKPAPTKPTPSAGLPPEPPGFLVVGIGASAGGLEAMEEFFQHMPPGSGMAFVVVSHQHVGHVSLLPGLLSKYTAMPVVEVSDGTEVKPDHVYLAPGGANLAILRGRLHLMEPSPQERVPLPIDYCVRSLAEDRKQGAVEIILSGPGTDGTLGLRALKAESGLTMAQAEQELREQVSQLEAIIDAATDGIITADQEGRVVMINQAAQSMFGCRGVDAIGHPFDQFIPERFREAHHGHMSRFAESGGPFRAMQRQSILFGLRANGEEFPIEASISKVQVKGKVFFTVVLRDVTERKRAEEALRISEAFTRKILNSLTSHICVLDKRGIILTTNDAWKRFARENSDNAALKVDVGINYLEVCRQAITDGQSIARTALEGIEAVLAGRTSNFALNYPCHSPQVQRWFQMCVSRLEGSEGVVIIMHTDISEEVLVGKNLEKSVRLLNEKRIELESLSEILFHAQEEERKRVARELHDDFNQRMACLAFDLQLLARDADRDDPKQSVKQRIAQIHARFVGLSNDLHDMAGRLHSSLLEYVGLEVAMRDHVAEFTNRTGLPVTFISREAPKVLSLNLKINLFRIMQECLQNVFKHAQASEVTVKLSGSSKGVGLSVRDNGKGGDLEREDARIKGLGLTSMQERTRIMGGFLRAHSFQREGTKVCVWVPYSREGA